MNPFADLSSNWKTIAGLVFILAVILCSIGTNSIYPQKIVPDAQENALKALDRITGGEIFRPVFKKGGNLHINLLSLAYLPKAYYLKWFNGGSDLTNLGEYYYLGNVISLLFALLTLGVLLRLGKKLFNERSAVLGSLILTVSMGFVFHAHFATEDIVMTGLLALSVYLLVVYRLDDRRSYLYLGALVAGLAISAKASAGLLIIPYGWVILRKSFLGKDQETVPLYKQQVDPVVLIRYVLTVYGLFFIGYIATTPSLIVLPVKSLRHIIVETIFRWDYRDFTQPWPSYFLATYYLARSFGLPLFLLVVAGFFTSVYKWIKSRREPGLTAVFLFLLPYLMVVMSWDAIGDWAVLPAIPFLALLGGRFVDRLLNRRTLRVSGFILFGGILLFSFYYTLGATVKFQSDSKTRATRWLRKHISGSVEIDAYAWEPYLPAFPDNSQILVTPILNGPTPRWVLAMKRLKKGKPDVIVLSSSMYDRYFEDPEAFPGITKVFRALLNDKTSYRIQRRFGPPIRTQYGFWRYLKNTVRPYAMHPIDPTIVILA